MSITNFAFPWRTIKFRLLSAAVFDGYQYYLVEGGFCFDRSSYLNVEQIWGTSWSNDQIIWSKGVFSCLDIDQSCGSWYKDACWTSVQFHLLNWRHSLRLLQLYRWKRIMAVKKLTSAMPVHCYHSPVLWKLSQFNNCFISHTLLRHKVHLKWVLVKGI